MAQSKDPYDFSHVPDDPAAESRPATTRDEEWQDYRELCYLLLRNGVPIESVNGVVGPISTVEDLAATNAALFTLGEQYDLPRAWMVKEIERRKRKRSRGSANFSVTGGKPMSWLKKAAPGDGPEMEHQLPTKARPDLGGPIEDGLSAGPSGPGKLPAEGPGKPPMGGKPPMPAGPKGPGGKPPAGVDEIKMLLEKGDLNAALDALKKLLPGGGDKSPAPPHKAPNLGKPPTKPGEKEPAKPMPKGAPEKGEGKPEDKDEKDEEKAPKASFASLNWHGHCPACDYPIEVSASSDEVEAQ